MNWKALGITGAFVAGLVVVMAIVVYCISIGMYWPGYFVGGAVIGFCGVHLYLVIKDDR